MILKNIQTGLTAVKPEYNTMLQNIDAKLPAVAQATSNFYKSHSQFMGVTLDVTSITPIRSAKHTLAEIERTRAALQEAHIAMLKKDIEIRRKEKQLEDTVDSFDREMIEVELLELRTHMHGTQNSMQGAIRKMNFFVNQYDNLMKSIGKTELTEEDYEKEEARYHIMTCMKQALNAARSRGGQIDEGNLIYLFDLGINSAQAQAEIYAYLNMENELMTQGKAPTHEMTVKWLESCADKWQSCPQEFAESRGFKIFDEQSLTNVPQIKG